MKIYLRLTLLLLSLLFLLTACDKGGKDDNDDDSGHKHSAAEWTVDLDGHKMICQCGEEFSVGKHNLKNDICTVCNTEVYTFEDGTVMVSVYDTYGYCVLCLYYDDKGVLETKEETVYTYDEDGSLAASPAANIAELMTNCGFSRIIVNRDYLITTDYDGEITEGGTNDGNNIGVCIGSKELKDDTTLIAVAIRGGGYGDEWIGDFNIYGSDTEHVGFEIANRTQISVFNLTF